MPKYNSCILFLRQKTYDKNAFPLVFTENVNYGFRRNLWGMKAAGMLLAFIAVAASLVAAVLNAKDGWPPAVAIVATLLNALLFAWWAVRINPDWIRIPAFAYAERLLATCDTLRPPDETQTPAIVTP